MNNIVDLWVPTGIFWVINPYQVSDGATVTMSGAKQKQPNNMEGIHPGLSYFYGLLKPQDFGVLIDVVLFWFGPDLQYCAIGIGPFGRTPDHEQEMKKFGEFAKKIKLPSDWLHVIFYQEVK